MYATDNVNVFQIVIIPQYIHIISKLQKLVIKFLLQITFKTGLMCIQKVIMY